MIIFSSVDPGELIQYVGHGPLGFVEKLMVFNLLSYDIRFQKVNRLVPVIPNISQEAFDKDESSQFEAEYFHYIDTNEAAFLDLMKIMVPEFDNGSKNLILVQIMYNSPFSESVSMSLIKYLYLRYGVIASFVSSPQDLLDLSTENSLLSREGLARMDHNISVLKSICPEILAYA